MGKAGCGYELFFEFPVPLGDTVGASFLDVDKPTFFMLWIRLEVERRAQARQDWTREQLGQPDTAEPIVETPGSKLVDQWRAMSTETP